MRLNQLTYYLYNIFRLCFWVSLIWTSILIAGMLSKKILQEFNIMNESYENTISCKIPVTLKITPNQTFFDENKKNNEIIVKSMYNKKTDLIKFSQKKIKTNTNISITSSKTWLQVIIIIKRLIKWLISLGILYFLKNIFYELKDSLEITKNIVTNTRKISFVFLIGTFIKLIISLVFFYSFNSIHFISKIDNKIIDLPGVIVNIYSRLEFNIPILILGISLLIISQLFKEALKIKQENELTI